MNYMKRLFVVIFSLILFIMPVVSYAADPPGIGATWGEASTMNGYDSVDNQIQSTNNLGGGGLGYYIKLVKYDPNTKKETIVGKPILLYSGGFLSDITNVDSGAGSATINNNSGGETLVCVGNCASNMGNPNAPNGGNALHITPGSNPVSFGQQVGSHVVYNGATYFVVDLVTSDGENWHAGDSCTQSSTNVYSAEQISYYKNKDIKFLFDSSVSDSGASSKWKDKSSVNIVKSAVDLSSVSIYNYAKIYLFGSDENFYNNDSKLFRNNNGKGIVTLDKIFSAFSITSNDFDMLNMDSYYFSIEPVTRERTNNVVRSWSSSQSSTSTSGSASWRWSCEYSGKPDYISSTSAQPERGSHGCYVINEERIDRVCTVKDTNDSDGDGNTTECIRWKDVYGKVRHDGKWANPTCASYKYVRTSILITNHTEKISVIQPAREGTNENAIKLTTTSIDQPESSHCVLDRENNCTGVYEYFIGPNLQTALAGTTGNNKYQLYDSTKNHAFTRASANINAVGVSYWWLPGLMNCKRECSGRTGDDLLMCAENFCDNAIGYDERANTQKLKAYCITTTCGYEYTPVSCAIANPYRNMQSADLGVTERSTCGIMDDGSYTTDNGKTKVTCVDDSAIDIFDQKTYINVACKETTGIGFTDLTGKKLVAGQGINYYVNQIGNRECSVFWDTATWKFAYASYHSQDQIRVKGEVISTREQLVEMLEYFNSAQDNMFSKAIGIDLSGADYVKDEYSSWSSLNYNEKLNIETEVKEIVNNKVDMSGKYTLVETYRNPATQTDVVDNTNTKAIFSLQSRVYDVNGYLQKSDVTSTYTFDKYCVSKDGKSIVKLAEDNGTCPNEAGFIDDELGKNLYYTDLNATANSKFTNAGFEHSVTSIVKNEENLSEELNNDSCPYEIDGAEFECVIDVVANEGTEMHGNGIYARGGVVANLVVRDKLATGDSIKTTEISVGETKETNTISLNITDARKGHEQFDIVGTVETVKGKKAVCKKTIHIINPDQNCGVRCSVEKVEDYIYEIKSVGRQNPRQYFSASSVNFNFVKLAPDVRNGSYLVRVDKRRTDYYLYGKVVGSIDVLGDYRYGTTCNDVCWIKIPCEGEDCEQEKYNCENNYKKADYEGIKTYCESYWDLDVNNYRSVDDCQKQCEIGICPDDVSNIDVVRNHCDRNYVLLGFDTAENCVNYCFYNSESSSDYIFRQVNNYNPFPNSNDSNTLGYNYPTGNRVIGDNWVDKSKYIKQDDDDTTSITGVHANQSAEYVIELTPNDIERIRQDTASYNASTEGNDAYLDYVYMDNVDTTKRYYSKFINETFRTNFKMINGQLIG